jgi:DNA adenine methylase
MALQEPFRNASQEYRPSGVRPFLKWAGGKGRLVQEISRFIPTKFDRYIEPFVGGGALFFSLCPSNAILSDSNVELIDCYETVRDHPKDLLLALQEIAELPYGEETYYEIRKWKIAENLKIKRAARMIYLNRTAFNGLYRVNRSGQFNTPFGKYKRLSLPDEKVILAASKALGSAKLIAGDFEVIKNLAQRGDFIFLDPPYPAISKYSDFNRYTKDFFSEKDHERLSEWVIELDEIGCTFVLSNADHSLIRELYGKFRLIQVFAPRYINCKGDRRGSIAEVIITNNSDGR